MGPLSARYRIRMSGNLAHRATQRNASDQHRLFRLIGGVRRWRTSVQGLRELEMLRIVARCRRLSADIRHLGDVVRALRQDAGMSLRQLARRSNVDISSLSRLEKHIHHTLAPDNLAKVAQALGVSVEELQRQVGQDGGPPPLRRWPTLE